MILLTMNTGSKSLTKSWKNGIFYTKMHAKKLSSRVEKEHWTYESKKYFYASIFWHKIVSYASEQKKFHDSSK